MNILLLNHDVVGPGKRKVNDEKQRVARLFFSNEGQGKLKSQALCQETNTLRKTKHMKMASHFDFSERPQI